MQFFSYVFTLLFVPHVLFHIFHLGKLLLALNRLIVIPVNLNFFLGSENSPSLFWAYQLISLLNLINPGTTIFFHPLWSAFHPCDNTMAFLSLRLIAAYGHFLISVWSWQNICGVLTAFDEHLILSSLCVLENEIN